jgi:hypothetical protein
VGWAFRAERPPPHPTTHAVLFWTAAGQTRSKCIGSHRPLGLSRSASASEEASSIPVAKSFTQQNSRNWSIVGAASEAKEEISHEEQWKDSVA